MQTPAFWPLAHRGHRTEEGSAVSTWDWPPRGPTVLLCKARPAPRPGQALCCLWDSRTFRAVTQAARLRTWVSWFLAFLRPVASCLLSLGFRGPLGSDPCIHLLPAPRGGRPCLCSCPAASERAEGLSGAE